MPRTSTRASAQGVVTNLASPDIIAVEEVQDNTGAADDGTVAADQTLTRLTAAISAAGGPFYQWREIDPVNDKDGGQPGGNIRVVFLFNPARVTFDDRGSSSVDRSTTATTVTKAHGQPDLTLSPGRIDPASDAWTSSRKPLVGEFTFHGQNVFVIGNHFDFEARRPEPGWPVPVSGAVVGRAAPAAGRRGQRVRGVTAEGGQEGEGGRRG